MFLNLGLKIIEMYPVFDVKSGQYLGKNKVKCARFTTNIDRFTTNIGGFTTNMTRNNSISHQYWWFHHQYG